MKKISLNNCWMLRQEEMEITFNLASMVARKTDGWMQTVVPCDVRMPLIENGVISDPVLKDNCFESEWIEEKSWWFKKCFKLTQKDIDEYDLVEIVFESLDCHADIFINGTFMGHQSSAFYPFTKELKKHLIAGENEIVVRLTTGLEKVCDEDFAAMRYNIATESGQGCDERGDFRRVLLRKPQYSMGWDWGPRVTSCGIVKDVYLQLKKEINIETVHVVTDSIKDQTAFITIKVEINNLHEISTQDSIIAAQLYFNNQIVVEQSDCIYIQAGMNYVEFKLTVESAKLWWPNGSGESNLYTLKVTAHGHTFTDEKIQRVGLRTVRLILDKVDDNRRLFGYEINGRKIFAKGGNWVPADSIYARVSIEKYVRLVKEAKNANFNLLRVWGGGLYEQEAFYNACDENGIMVWQDFMFACALYPDDKQWFCDEVEKEITYQTKVLSIHPCIVMFCGNNENHTAYMSWWKGKAQPKFFGGGNCYHYIAPKIIQNNCSEIPYWRGSPYGGKNPSEALEGDIHPWGHFFMSSNVENRITPQMYDELDASFVSEYGYVGPCCKKTTLQYLNGEPIENRGKIWNVHNNTFEKNTVISGVHKHFSDKEHLSTDEYLLYAGLCQGMMLGSSLEAFRSKPLCGGSIFWMYNDTWGEVGWTIIDYYLRRKISYYFVARAFAPTKLIVRKKDNRIIVSAINDTAEPIYATITLLLQNFNGIIVTDEKYEINVPSCYRGEVINIPYIEHSSDTMIVVTCSNPKFEHEVLAEAPIKSMHLPKPQISIKNIHQEHDNVILKVFSDSYAYGVHFNFDDDVILSDNYFEMLPNTEKEITAYNTNQKSGIEVFSVAIGSEKETMV